jgi:EmrB/QacA subfamily drug resistance transporter
MTETRSTAVAKGKVTSAPQPIPAHVWRVAGVVVFGAVMGMLDTSLVNIGLRRIGDKLHAQLDTVQWVASGYLLALAVALPMCSWLARRVGAGRLWVGALVAFTIASGLCALAVDTTALIALRVLQGLAAGFLIPAGQTLLGQTAGPKQMGRVMSVVGIAVVGAPAVGPTIGGLMLAHLSWQWLFLINIPLGLAALVLGLRVLPLGPGATQGPLDVRGLVFAAAGVYAVVYGLGNIAAVGSVTALSVWLPVVLGLLGLVVFVRGSLRKTQPLLDIRMFSNRVFAAANSAGFFAGAAMFGAMVLLPLYFQVLHGDGLVRTGLLLIGFGLGGVITFPVGGRLSDRVGGGIVAMVGNFGAAATTLPFAFLDGHANAVLVQALLFLRGVATALSGVPLTSAAYAAVRRDQVPDAAAFVNILQRVGGALGVAVIAIILSRAAATGLGPTASYRTAFAATAGLSVIAAAAAALLARHERR